MDLGDHKQLDSRKSDAQIVAAALERQIAEALLSSDDSHESKSVFIPLTTATIPICVERGPSADWTCCFVFDRPQVHSDGVVEYRLRSW
jgi:hypothetical protein